jgi:hypothetical protein
MPVVGICASNYVSGSQMLVQVNGAVQAYFSGDTTWSGMAGKPLYVGSGGIICTQSGLLSGMGWQGMGTATSGGFAINIDAQIRFSGVQLPMLGAGVI